MAKVGSAIPLSGVPDAQAKATISRLYRKLFGNDSRLENICNGRFSNYLNEKSAMSATNSARQSCIQAAGLSVGQIETTDQSDAFYLINPEKGTVTCSGNRNSVPTSFGKSAIAPVASASLLSAIRKSIAPKRNGNTKGDRVGETHTLVHRKLKSSRLNSSRSNDINQLIASWKSVRRFKCAMKKRTLLLPFLRRHTRMVASSPKISRYQVETLSSLTWVILLMKEDRWDDLAELIHQSFRRKPIK